MHKYKQMANNNIYDWWFVKNPYTNKWMAAKGEHRNDLKNNIKSPHILSSSSITTLEYLISKTDGDPKKLKKIVK